MKGKLEEKISNKPLTEKDSEFRNLNCEEMRYQASKSSTEEPKDITQ